VSIRNTVRALPTLIKVGFASAVAYRAELFVWILATTMPLIMLALWSTVAHEAPIGRFGEREFVAYFLVTFIVRQLTGSWVAWELNYEVRQGVLATRLLRPVNAVICYAVENLCALPLRLVIAVPIALIGLFTVGRHMLPRGGLEYAMLAAAILGGWLITFLVNVAIGTLSLFMDSSVKLTDVWFAGFLVFSGYQFPVELFPDWLEAIGNRLPFRYQIGLAVEIATRRHPLDDALELLLAQWCFVAALGVLVIVLWTRGMRRFAAYGG
jgi:ABC-2 type transport system permease protein